VDFVLLTGDPKWADVALQINMRSDGQNTGRFALILRATPKPNRRILIPGMNLITRRQTAQKEPATPPRRPSRPKWMSSGIAPPDDVPNLRILKVVGGKYKLLAETDFDTSKTPIPEVNAAGPDNAGGAIFRAVAKGQRASVLDWSAWKAVQQIPRGDR